MDNRKKDTNIEDKNLQDILNDDSIIPEDVDPADRKDLDVEEETPELNDIEEKEEEEVEIEEEEPKKKLKKEEKEETDYKRKYSDSSREASALYFKNKTMTDTIESASALPDPTEAELVVYAREQGAVFEDLDDFSQNILKKTLINERKFGMIHEATIANKEVDNWSRKVDEFTNSAEILAKYPSIGENDVDFKKYAMKEARRGTDLNDLVASFLFNMQGDNATPKKPAKKGSLLLSRGGGEGTPKPSKLTAEDVRIIRNKDPKRYKQLIKDGKVGMDVLDLE